MGKKISELTPAGVLSTNDIIPIVTANGDNKTVTGGNVKTFAADGKQDSLYGGTLSTGNLNNFNTENKNYWVNCANVSNTPINAGFGVLEVIKFSTGLGSLQRFTRFGTNTDATRGEMYIRFYANNQWYNWVKIAQITT